MKHVERAITVLAVLSALFTLAFVVFSFGVAPQNPVASEMQFEASRVAQGYPLYVDPWKGAWELGAPPSRYFVLYTPIFPTLIGKLSATWRALGSSPVLVTVQYVGRTVAVLAWLAFHVPVVVFAPKERRRATMLAAMLAAGIYFIARHAASMSPDALATALVCGGVLRAVVRKEIDPVAAMLLIAGPFVKPSCLGGVAGAAIVLLAQRRPGWLRALGAGLVTFLVFVGLCHAASDGAWLHHITSSTGQPLTLTRWVQEMGSRVMLLGLPHAVLAWLAWKRRVTWLALGPLLGSLAWATFMMAKHGSGSHYWFEPTGLALIVLSRLPVVAENAKRLSLGALAFAIVSAIVSWPAFLSESRRSWDHRGKVVDALEQRLREPCENKFIVSSEFDVEMVLNGGHISVPQWQSGFLARAGKFPTDEWKKDLVRPEVSCVAIASDPRRPPAATHDEQVELSPFYDILREPLFETFEFYDVVGGMYVFKRKR